LVPLPPIFPWSSQKAEEFFIRFCRLFFIPSSRGLIPPNQKSVEGFVSSRPFLTDRVRESLLLSRGLFTVLPFGPLPECVRISFRNSVQSDLCAQFFEMSFLSFFSSFFFNIYLRISFKLWTIKVFPPPLTPLPPKRTLLIFFPPKYFSI